jgi:hypothetical protein
MATWLQKWVIRRMYKTYDSYQNYEKKALVIAKSARTRQKETLKKIRELETKWQL